MSDAPVACLFDFLKRRNSTILENRNTLQPDLSDRESLILKFECSSFHPKHVSMHKA